MIARRVRRPGAREVDPALAPRSRASTSSHLTIDLPTTVTDRYHQAPLQPLQVAFTTAAM